MARTNVSERVRLHGSATLAWMIVQEARGLTRHASASLATKSATKTVGARDRCQASATAANMCCGKASAARAVLQPSTQQPSLLQKAWPTTPLKNLSALLATHSVAQKDAKAQQVLSPTATVCAQASSWTGFASTHAQPAMLWTVVAGRHAFFATSSVQMVATDLQQTSAPGALVRSTRQSAWRPAQRCTTKVIQLVHGFASVATKNVGKGAPDHDRTTAARSTRATTSSRSLTLGAPTSVR